MGDGKQGNQRTNAKFAVLIFGSHLGGGYSILSTGESKYSSSHPEVRHDASSSAEGRSGTRPIWYNIGNVNT